MVGILTLLFVMIEIPVLIVIAIASSIAKAAKGNGEKKQQPTPQSARSKELSDEQREKIVKAILEDSLLENDSAFDSLMYEGEANYPAADACQIDAKEFDLQYGSKSWLNAWQNTLSMWFDCQSEYAKNGVFHLYGKEV